MAVLIDRAPDFIRWTWADLGPRYRDLERQTLTSGTVDGFLRDWSALSEHVDEIQRRLWIGTTCDTANEDIAVRYKTFLAETYPPVQQAEQELRRKLLDSGLRPAGFEMPLRKMRADAALFREENLPLETEEKALSEQYFQITGGQTVNWEGKDVPASQIFPIFEELDREKRERAWRALHTRQLSDREAINALWQKELAVRVQLAANAGFSDYRAYRWQQLKRFDYTPADATRLHAAVEEVIVPVVVAAARKRQERLGVERLRPWDLQVDPLSRPPIRPFADVSELTSRMRTVFGQVDQQLGSYFDSMVGNGFLDLDSRPNKAPGGYSYGLHATGSPFIFWNATGTALDIEVLLHEAGHSFHFFERRHLPYFQQRSDLPMEFNEVASMAMELLAEPYLRKSQGGFYSDAEARQAAGQHLETRVLAGWPHLVTTDMFQHWVYENPDEARDPSACDAKWMQLLRRFTPYIDRTGLEQEEMTGWHNILHIHTVPFYMIEYGMAQLGAVQIWANARRDQSRAVTQYRHALSLGGTRPVAQLYEAAGARFVFDVESFRSAVRVIEGAIAELEDHQAG
jgi:oligoendopeptidase F